MSFFSVIEIDLHLRERGVRASLVATRRPIEGAPDDWVACVAYFTADDARRWAVVQRVGPVVSSTLDLDAETAARSAISIARREEPRAPIPPGGADA